MIQMAMGEKDSLRCESHRTELSHNDGVVTTGVDNGGVKTLFAPEDGAVLLERGYWDDLEFHSIMNTWLADPLQYVDLLQYDLPGPYGNGPLPSDQDGVDAGALLGLP